MKHLSLAKHQSLNFLHHACTAGAKVGFLVLYPAVAPFLLTKESNIFAFQVLDHCTVIIPAYSSK